MSLSPIYASFEADEQIVSGILPNCPQESMPATSSTAFQSRWMSPASRISRANSNSSTTASIPQSGTIRVRAVFDNANGAPDAGPVRPVEHGPGKTEDAVLVNERAIGTDQNKKYVMVVEADNTTEYREVTVGVKSDGLRVVTSGLKAQERIVVNGLQRIRPGALVAPEMVVDEAGAAAHAGLTSATANKPLTGTYERAIPP